MNNTNDHIRLESVKDKIDYNMIYKLKLTAEEFNEIQQEKKKRKYFAKMM
eukprot:CAMPEP_0116956482 /NCGR_PEP_ID=MMETSP0467-20121206/43354_1 /TAXON_ID=283647 /ORGANISM="Mesodinium pulex, Strain SPMC105" /LENGTH=49 /DNA_ID=CAMNT_0004642953 /DNA_START=101 /DNA_END=250 /DNA_ORIENTATION=-